MKIILIGASGTLWQGYRQRTRRAPRDRPGRPQQRRFPVSTSATRPIRALFEKTGRLTRWSPRVGKVHFGALEEMGEAQYQLGLRDKLMGRVNLVLLGREYANDGGSFTPHQRRARRAADPLRQFGEHGQLRRRGLRPRRSPGVAARPAHQRRQPRPWSARRCPATRPTSVASEPVPAADAALGYARSVEGAQTGQVPHLASNIQERRSA